MIADRLLSLADIACPILSVVGTVDEIAPARGVRAISSGGAAGRCVRAGAARRPLRARGRLDLERDHLAYGRRLGRTGATARASCPSRSPKCPTTRRPSSSRRCATASATGSSLPVASALGLRDRSSGAARRTARGMRELTVEAAGQLPRLARLEQVQPATRISLGLLVDERTPPRRRTTPSSCSRIARTAPREVDERIDNVVRGLISIGVRQGEHVGVLMGPRPSALALRGGAEPARRGVGAAAPRRRYRARGDARPGAPDHRRPRAGAPRPPGSGTVHTFVLGGGGGPRDLGVAADDRHGADRSRRRASCRSGTARTRDAPATWRSSSSPARASSTRMSRITNRRWVTSAFGTASSAALSGADTVYSVTPLYHPSGLMMSVGGAIAGGARLAMATTFDPSTFWEEVRRYGVTVASYTWTLLHELVAGAARARRAPSPGAAVHGLWDAARPVAAGRAALRPRAGARVLRLHRDRRDPRQPPRRQARLRWVGRCRAAPRSGSPPTTSTLVSWCSARDGFVRECRTDEVGMLLARSRADAGVATIALRGVFARDDAWLATGDLFRRDADGDYWRLDGVGEVIRSAGGPVFTAPIRDALADLPAVDLAVAYGIAGRRAGPSGGRRRDAGARRRARTARADRGAVSARPRASARRWCGRWTRSR